MKKEIYFAAGCFWGTEKLFQSIRGVLDTECGFANGNPEINASYRRVCQGDTGYRETVYVAYDPEQVTLPQLLKAYFHVVDPTVENRQGPDVGPQYQAGIYFVSQEDGDVVREYCAREAEKYPRFTVEQLPLNLFTPAEEYHQDYLTKNPDGYCHIPRADFDRIDALIR